MAVSKDDILETISNMTVLEVVDLIDAMEEKFNVSAAAAAVAVAAPAAEGGAGAAEQTEFDVILSSFGSSKVNVIKVVKDITKLGLKETKELVDNAPGPIKEGVSKEEAEELKGRLEEAGASVEIK